MLFNSNLQNGCRNIREKTDDSISLSTRAIQSHPQSQVEGFTQMTQSQKNSQSTPVYNAQKQLLNDTQIDTDEVTRLKTSYLSVLDEYEQELENVKNAQIQYINRINSSNPYLNTLVKFTTGHACFVTSMGVVRYIPSMQTLNELKKVWGPLKKLNIPFLPEYKTIGTPIQTTPMLIAGPVLKYGETVGHEGSTVIVDQVIDPNTKIAFTGCYGPSNEADLEFIGSRPDKSITDGGKYTFESCKNAAIDSGYKFFGLNQMNTMGDLSKGHCTVGQVQSKMDGGGPSTKTSSIVWHWTTNTNTKSNVGISASVQPSGSLSVFDSKGTSVFSTPIDSNSIANYVGCYGDNSKRMLPTNFGNNYTYETCSKKTNDNKLSYFGLQNIQPNKTAECWGGDDLSRATQLGQSKNCMDDGRGALSGGGWANAIYSQTQTDKFFVMIEDSGNMSIFKGSGPTDKQALIWESNTSASLNDADIAFSAKNGKTGKNWMAVGTVLYANEFIGSPSGNIYLIMQSDGNLSLGTSVQVSNCNIINNGKFGGGVGATAIYNTEQTGFPKNLHKTGYVDQMGTLHNYPDSTLSLNTTFLNRKNYDAGGETLLTSTQTSAIGCRNECVKNSKCGGIVFDTSTNKCLLKTSSVQPNGGTFNTNKNSFIRSKVPTNLPKGARNNTHSITSVQYENYVLGDDISDSSIFGISNNILKSNTPTHQNLDQLKGRLNIISEKIIQLTGKFNKYDIKLSKQSLENASQINTFSKEYVEKNARIKRVSTNTSNILDDSKITIKHEYYQYSLWALAVAAAGTVAIAL
jgi:hypothetical protein